VCGCGCVCVYVCGEKNAWSLKMIDRMEFVLDGVCVWMWVCVCVCMCADR